MSKTYTIPNYKRPKGVTTITRQQFDQAKLEERSFGMLIGLATACVTLRGGKDPYGKKRMTDFLHDYAVQINCLAERYVTADDLIKILIDEVGLNLLDPEIRKAFPGLAKLQKEKK